LYLNNLKVVNDFIATVVTILRFLYMSHYLRRVLSATIIDLQDPKVASELESLGTGSVEQRTVTICSGLDFVNVTYNNFIARSEETANVRLYRCRCSIGLITIVIIT